MQVQEARRILGLAGDTTLDVRVVRAAYRRMVRHAHPDVSAHPDAAARTARLTQAYDLLTAAARPVSGAGRTDAHRPSEADSPDNAPTAPTTDPSTASRAATAPPGIRVVLLDDTSISVAAPADETLMLLLDAAHSLGDISYLDPSAGLVEVVVEFVEAPTSSVLFSFQGRADGTTEVFCTVEPLSGGEAPPAPAVARLVVETLRSAQP